MRRRPFLALLCAGAAGAALPRALRPAHAGPGAAAVPIVGLPCEGCEAVFDRLPADLSAAARLAPAGQPGEPLSLDGVVVDRNGRPRAGVIVYAYQTDRDGHYPEDPRLSGAAARHGRLRAWARTDTAGRYRFSSIRPGAYPGRADPQHIHMHLIEPGRCTYYLGDVLFDDDPRLSARWRAAQAKAHGGSGIVTPRGGPAGWRATRDIVLGANVAGYPG